MRLIKHGALLAGLIVGLAAGGGASANAPGVNNHTHVTAGG
ncbi:MAG: hypothetical protein VX935_08230 [Pseudomonadota bacterium]|nr:hypothetical protein [Pseudomonadota bacterium]